MEYEAASSQQTYKDEEKVGAGVLWVISYRQLRRGTVPGQGSTKRCEFGLY
jgi:hypothetical protein